MFPLLRTYVNLDTDCFPFAPKINRYPVSTLKPAWVLQPFTNKGIPQNRLHAIGPLLGPDGHSRWPFALANPPVLIRHQDGCRNGDRRICSDQNSDYQGKAEPAQHLAAE